ncbi:MAG: hypothetical protein IPK63_23490 [Candidatus Competibacteraceae bacterium]|nr:hypothetical protein [Candidatus Competibacteraceae bacterium]
MLLRLAGSSLSRLAERTLAGLLFQAPPRTHGGRLSVRSPSKGYTIEEASTKAECIRMAGMAKPGLDAGINLRQR